MSELITNMKSIKQYQKILLALALLACFAFVLKALSLIHLTSLWLDELRTVEKSFQPSLTFLVNQLRRNVHPPFYYLVLWGLSKVFGETATFLRSFSWVSYISAAVLLCFASWNYSRSGAAAVLALSLSLALPINVTYSIEGKAYAFIYALICAASFFRIRLLAGDRRIAFAYSISWGLAALTHYYGMGLLLCQIVLDLYHRRNTVKPLAWALVVPTLWMLINLGFLAGHGGRQWLRKSGAWLLRKTLNLVLGNYWPLLLLILCVLIILLHSSASSQRESRSIRLLSDWGLDAGALLFLATFLVSIVKPSSYPRYYIVAVPSLIGFFSCWVGLQLHDPARRHQRFGMVAIVLTAVLTIFWFDSFQSLIPSTQGADRYQNDFRTPALLGAQSQFKYTPQCKAFNAYDHVLKQEGLIKPAAAWGCLAEDNDWPNRWTDDVLRALGTGEQIVFLAVTGPSVHGARPIEPYVAALQARGMQCVPDVRNTAYARSFHCTVKR